MRTRLLGLGAVVVVASVALIGAQHRPDSTHSAGMHAPRTDQSHHACDPAAAGHHAEMAAALGLTAEQTTAIERISAEACAAMARYHEQILAVLTPEQRTKMQQHHETKDGHAGEAPGSKRHHGGR